MTIQFGKCKSISGARARVTLTGFSSDASIDCLIMQPCAHGPSVWLPPAVGDIVVISVNEERLEDSIVLGVIYTDKENPPKTGNNQAAMKYTEVYIGDPVPDTKASRDDKIQKQLNGIKSELDALTASFNSHVHIVQTVTAIDSAAIVAAAASGSAAPVNMISNVPTASHTQSYIVGETETECVWVR